MPLRVLEKTLHSFNSRVVVPPHIGIDVGVSRVKGKYLVSSSDPITGAVENVGWHAVNISANDVATCGIMPDVLNVVALFPKKTKASQIDRIMKEINTAASELGIAVLGGHTEITPGLNRPIITVTAIGSGNRFVTSADAKLFDTILMTKTAGIEGSSILARLPGVRALVSPLVSRRARALLKQLSVLAEAREAFSTGRVHAMHDVTEGGVLGAVYEMSVASNLGFELFSDRVPVDKSTKEICENLSADPLKLIGSGSLLISCKDPNPIVKKLESSGTLCTAIGRFMPFRNGRNLVADGKKSAVTEDSIQDELWRLLGKYGNLS